MLPSCNTWEHCEKFGRQLQKGQLENQIARRIVAPFGITNAPPLFQELMNQVISLCRQRPAVQELLKRGAVLGAHIDDVILGTNTIKNHLELQ